MSIKSVLKFKSLLAIVFLCFSVSSHSEVAPQVDYLTLSQGTIPVRLGGDAAIFKTGMDLALKMIDGDDIGFSMTPKPGRPDENLVVTFKLPALTSFDRFAVPNVLETPSPSQTFFRQLKIEGADSDVEGPYELLIDTSLERHSSKGQNTEIASESNRAVKWLRVSLKGGLDVQRDMTFYEFSELKGYGSQDQVPMGEVFTGKWKGRGVFMELKQEGARVTGCYDRRGELTGTVSGNVLRATGETEVAGINSTFVLAIGDQGEVIGVRSTNGAPFRLYQGNPAEYLTTHCSNQPVKTLGCGSVIHGINFNYDSADIRPDAEVVLDDLADGLKGENASKVIIIGHTSSEGSDQYNLKLSQQRAESVAAALRERGLDAGNIEARGMGELSPIADNQSEIGRSLNRRVEIECDKSG